MSNIKPEIKINLVNDKHNIKFWVDVSNFEDAMVKIRNHAMDVVDSIDPELAYDEAQHMLTPYGTKKDLDILAFDVVDSKNFVDPNNLPIDKTGMPCLVSITEDLAWGVKHYGSNYIACYDNPLINDHVYACELCESLIETEKKYPIYSNG